jgi:hypothetical protein
MPIVDTGIFIVKTVDFSIPKAHNLFGASVHPGEF